jgi:hypothetical protein
VESVTLASDVPFAGSGAIFYTAEGQPPVDATNVPRAYAHRVFPGYFKARGVGVRSGREFDANEPNSSVIVSENVVKRFWAGQDPIGKRIKSGNAASNSPWLNIVGVVAGMVVSRALHDLLFGVSPTDPSIFSLAALLVITTGTVAVFIPASRALRVDPMRALRDE